MAVFTKGKKNKFYEKRKATLKILRELKEKYKRIFTKLI